jgi:hypothetical protein
MTVGVLDDGTVFLEGACPSEDAEQLLQLLLTSSGAAVDWSACDSAHTAVLQVLLAVKPTLRGRPRNAFLAGQVAPCLAKP